MKLFLFIFLILYTNKFAISKENFIQLTIGTYENDSVILRKDRYYTNGVQLLFVSRNFEIKQAQFYNYSFGIGQKIYTPYNIKLAVPIINDRPYAGYLYFFLNKNMKYENKIDSFGFSAGLTGPSSLGEKTQTKIHKLIGSASPRGWEQQLKDEFLFMLMMSRIIKIKEITDNSTKWSSFSKFSTNIGTPSTDFSSLFEIRYGKNLHNDFIINKMNANSQGIEKIDGSIGWYYFLNGEIKYIIYNTFLDGNINRIKPNIVKNNFLYEIGTGIAYNKNKFYVKTSMIYLSKEFKEQKQEQVIFVLNLGMIDF